MIECPLCGRELRGMEVREGPVLGRLGRDGMWQHVEGYCKLCRAAVIAERFFPVMHEAAAAYTSPAIVAVVRGCLDGA